MNKWVSGELKVGTRRLRCELRRAIVRYVGLYLQIAGAVEGGEGSLVVIQHINYTAEDHFYCGQLTD